MDCNSWVIRDGTVLCEGMSLEHLRRDLQYQYGPGASPLFVYSCATLVHNVRCYLDALKSMGAAGVLAYSMKANGNPRVAAALLEAGVQRATCVSGNEMKAAIRAGFPLNKLILNGNGKRKWEVEEAVRGGSLLNVDSIFDACRVVEVATDVGLQAKLLLRLNPAIDALTHPYLSTAMADCKFGIEESQVKQVLGVLWSARNSVKVEGVHVHLGSAITDLSVYGNVMQSVSRVLYQIRQFGWHDAAVVNLGGGLGVFPAPHQLPRDHPLALIDTGTSMDPTPTPADLMKVVLPLLPEGVTLILEPGRSLVASAGVLMTEILGVKTNGGKVFVVTDAAMTEVIRPALYGSKHPVTRLTQPKTDTILKEAAHLVDVVGPVCESGDYLAKDCRLPPPAVTQGDCLLVWMTGAYCSAMASNYNMRPHVMEVMVHGPANYKIIRRPQNFDDIMKEYQ
ncbi:probable diaminopimelate decarboxylase, chloroplastic isoform X2 [Portunus trituberculatus]|uniref:probable diaminopimelate decarboxylase, chloroplastic isoform X2 n=1 Tax=Portunus trituberculatus TaxID=210409 RepID=UPI001E1CBB7D|nr:probable diaminopimelate decarboxylase, chloroplastic isoform X2 [Portunus trituberculatus]